MPEKKQLEDLVASREGRRFLKGNSDVFTRQHVGTQTRRRAYVSGEERKDVTVKLRKPIVEALQKAMHERTLQYSRGKLQDGEPYTRQDIVDTAVEAWLRTNGYLSPAKEE